jgi:hypothetical protein
MKKSEQNELIEAVLKELKRCGISIKKSSKGHRALLRSNLETAQRIIVQLSSDEMLQSQFVHAVKKAEKGRKHPTAFNWHLEVVAMATGASSGKSRKLASKRAGVLEYLRERGVAVNETVSRCVSGTCRQGPVGLDFVRNNSQNFGEPHSGQRLMRCKK